MDVAAVNNETKESDTSSLVPPPPTPPSPQLASSSASVGHPSSPTKPTGTQSVHSQKSEMILNELPQQQSFSWDSKNVANAIDQVSRESRASIPAKPKVGHVVTLSQISKTCPVEEEAERLILKALDEKKDRPKLGSTILPQVPDNNVAAFDNNTSISSSANRSDETSSSHVKDEESSIHVNTSSSNISGPSLYMSVSATADSNVLSSHPSLQSQHQHPNTTFGKLIMHVIRRKPRRKSKHIDPERAPSNPEEPETTSNTDAFVHNASVLFRPSTYSNKLGGSPDIERGNSSCNDSDPSGKSRKRNPNERMKQMAKQARTSLKNELGDFNSFARPFQASIGTTLKNELLYLILPLTFIATVLFYGAGNPALGNTGASISYLLLFLVRQILVLTLGKATSVFVIEYLSLSRRFTVKVFGPVIALAIVQSKGYPSVIFFFGLWSLILLCGSGAFARHWLFWQSTIDMCNANNPAGTITESTFYLSLVGCFVLFGAAVAGKRLCLGLYMGKRSYLNYSDKFNKTADDVVLVSEVAALSQPVDARKASETASHDDAKRSFHSVEVSSSMSEESTRDSCSDDFHQHEGLNSSQRAVIQQHLEAWEEPEAAKAKPNDATVSEILEFRQSLSMVDDTYPFTVAFGPADKRETCFESAQKVYYRLLTRQKSGDVLTFSTIAVVALNDDGTMNQEKMKELVRLFRPNRQGQLSEVDFLKSIDSLYKELRLLQAAIENSSSVDRAFEIMCNYIFFIILWCIMLYIVGINPLALFVSVSSFIVGFAFMIGSASSKYFEGILFIFVRRPFDIGDRVNVSNVEHDTSPDGSMTWFVEDLGLYSTTVRLAATNEVATYSNGSLANSRVINAARSPKAIVSVYLKFAVDVNFEKIELCRKTVEKFVKDRPREWIALQSFRAKDVVQDEGYVQYQLQLQHREGWQNLNSIKNSKSELTSFTLEVAKQLDMRYVPPPLPVDLLTSGDREFTKETARNET